jgi:hypothetical protein
VDGLRAEAKYSHPHPRSTNVSEATLLALVTLASGPIYANFGSGGIRVMCALSGEALPLVRGVGQAH